MYIEDIGHGKGGIVGAPIVTELGRYVSSHKRDFMQQSQYTIATKMKNDEWVYCAHEEYFGSTINNDHNLLTKIVLPASLRIEYLQKLQEMNINAFTLYGSEESLMDMLAFREIIECDL